MKTKKKISVIIFLTLCCFINPSIFAADAAKGPEQVIKSCIDDQTFAVIRVDIEKVNINAFINMALEIINKQAVPEVAKNLEAELKEFQKIAQEQLNELLKTGGKDFFVVFSMYDFPYFFFAVPINKAGEKESIELFQKIQNISKGFYRRDLELYTVDKLIFVGMKQTISRLKTISPVQSELMAKAFQSCGDTTIQAVLFPTSDQRRILSEMLPQIPVDSGTINFTTTGKDLQWAALGINGPPSISLNVTIQSQNSQGAENLLTFIRNLYTFAEQNPIVQDFKPQLKELLTLLTPEKKENQLVLKVEPKTANSIIDNIIGPSLLKARAAAAKMTCASHLKQIGLGLLIYANDHADKFPLNLEILTSNAKLSPKILVCPFSMQKDSFIYRGASLITPDAPWLVLVYDKKGNHEGGRNILFLDGHVEWATEERFMEFIEADNKYRKEKGYKELPAEK